MAYKALYRTYRPQRFEDVIGQDVIVKTLQNAIANGKITHAYLFSGPRGTGKTTVARILAKALNCSYGTDNEPCNECTSCKEIMEGNNPDVIEIDAASNNGVDEIRDLREKIQYPPVSGKYKVYIVDEVHMLSIQAFNALLKTLEEPPAHAIFILATTEVQKIPDTILSRCMRFDFRLLPEETITSHLEYVFKEIGKDAEYSALRAIAAAGEGSMRDALSVADMCISFSTKKLTYNDVLDVLGATDRKIIVTLIDHMLAGNAKECIEEIDGIVRSGRSMGVLARDLSSMLRNALILKTNDKADCGLPEHVLAELRILSSKHTMTKLLGALEAICKLETEMKYSVQPRLLLEATALKIGDVKADLSDEGMYNRVVLLEKKIKELERKIASGVVVKESVTPATKKEIEIVPDNMDGDARRIWARFVKFVYQANMFALYAAALSVKEIVIDGNNFVVTVDDGTTNYSILSAKQNVEEVSRLLTKLTGVEYKFVCKLPEGVETPAEGDIERIKTLIGDDKLKIIK